MNSVGNSTNALQSQAYWYHQTIKSCFFTEACRQFEIFRDITDLVDQDLVELFVHGNTARLSPLEITARSTSWVAVLTAATTRASIYAPRARPVDQDELA